MEKMMSKTTHNTEPHNTDTPRDLTTPPALPALHLQRRACRRWSDGLALPTRQIFSAETCDVRSFPSPGPLPQGAPQSTTGGPRICPYRPSDGHVRISAWEPRMPSQTDEWHRALGARGPQSESPQ